MFKWIIVLFLFLQGCDTVPIRPTMDKTNVNIEVHWVDNPDTYWLSKGYTRPSWLRIQGVAYPLEDPCRIYVREPQYVNDENTCTLGHEVLHCLKGYYHKRISQ
jgi:hypothetical protein